MYEAMIKSLCHPDKTKACAACCGLFNHQDISENSLFSFLNDGSFRTENAWRYMQKGSYLEQTLAVRDRESHMCPFQGMVGEGVPGCLKHPLYCGKEERDEGLFGSKSCVAYLCPANTFLSNFHKEIIVSCIDGWYLYTIAIIDPFSTIWILDRLNNKMPPEIYRQKLQKALDIHAGYLQNFQGTVFCYSPEEYKMNVEFFSLKSNYKHIEPEKEEIAAMLNE